MERNRRPPPGKGERFRGYGVAGLSFRSGHVLALRRIVASTANAPLTSLWHRSPSGRWTLHVNRDTDEGRPSHVGGAIDEVVTGQIDISWQSAFALTVRAPEGRIEWAMRLSTDGASRTVGMILGAVPRWLWRREGFLRLLAWGAGRRPGLGWTTFVGTTPNKEWFHVNPRRIWWVQASAAVVDGEELGFVGPLPVEARLGDVVLPRRGFFMVGEGRTPSASSR